MLQLPVYARQTLTPMMVNNLLVVSYPIKMLCSSAAGAEDFLITSVNQSNVGMFADENVDFRIKNAPTSLSAKYCWHCCRVIPDLNQVVIVAVMLSNMARWTFRLTRLPAFIATVDAVRVCDDTVLQLGPTHASPSTDIFWK